MSLRPARLGYQTYGELLRKYWPERIGYIHEGYRTLPFPFAEIQPPAFEMAVDWDLERMAGFLCSRSAAERYLEQEGRHPMNIVWSELKEDWGSAQTMRKVQFPRHMRVGRVTRPEAAGE